MSQIPFTASPSSVSGTFAHPGDPGDAFTLTVTLNSPNPGPFVPVMCAIVAPYPDGSPNPLYPDDPIKELFYGYEGIAGLLIGTPINSAFCHFNTGVTTATLSLQISACVLAGPGNTHTIYVLPVNSAIGLRAGSQAGSADPSTRTLADAVFPVTVTWNAVSSSSVSPSSSSSTSPSSSSSGSGGTPPMSSSSSSSGYPYPITLISGARRCIRLMHPNSRTVERIIGNALAITVSMPFDIMNRYVSQMPNVGPDTLIVNYTDYQGQAEQFTRNVTFWMSDSGYVFLSQDQSKQFLIAGVNGTFFDANAQAIYNRNVSTGSVPLLPCENASRYDCPVLLPNQVRPTVWYRDGVLEPNGTSGTSGSPGDIFIIDPTANP